MGMFDHLGETFIVLRMLRGLSQADLARRAGIRPNQVSRYETGQVLPQLGQLEKILDALDVGLAELLFAMGHLERTAQLLDDSGRLPAEAMARDAVSLYWQEVTDLHLKMSREVTRVLRESFGPEAAGAMEGAAPGSGAGEVEAAEVGAAGGAGLD